MNAIEERQRFDNAVVYVSQALARINRVFSGAHKIENIILAYKYLEAASKILGRDMITEAVAHDPQLREVLEAIDLEVGDLTQRIETGTNEPGDSTIISVKF